MACVHIEKWHKRITNSINSRFQLGFNGPQQCNNQSMNILDIYQEFSILIYIFFFELKSEQNCLFNFHFNGFYLFIQIANTIIVDTKTKVVILF